MIITYYNKKGVLRASSLFKIDEQDYYIFHRGYRKWLLCKDYPVGLLTLLYIPFSKLLQYFEDNNNPIIYFPFDETILFAFRKDFWARQAIENWLRDDKFVITEELKTSILQKNLSHLNLNLQARLEIILSK